MISQAGIVNFVAQYKDQFEAVSPSFFEWTVALAFDHFRNEKVDIAIIETGLGGRLDSTNIITPIVSVITNIDYDHMDLLGDTLEMIAVEKAGIIKEGIPVVTGHLQHKVKQVIKRVANNCNADIFYAGLIYKLLDYQYNITTSDFYFLNTATNKALKIKSDLPGYYQSENIPVVLSVLEILNKCNFKIEDKHQQALQEVKKITGFRGRWDIISEDPLTIADTAHNKDGIKQVLRMLQSTPFRNLHFVFGVVSDKDYTSILSTLPKHVTYYFCNAQIPRALPADKLKEEALKFNLTGKSYTSVSEALNAAKDAAKKNDLVFIGGSTFVVAEAI